MLVGLLLLLLLFPFSGRAAQIQFETLTGRITGVRFDPANPIDEVPGRTLVNCSGTACGGAATIADPITWPVPAQGNGSAGTWTTCSEGRQAFTVVSSNTLVVNPQITSTAGGHTLFYCQRVSNRRMLFEAVKEPVIAELMADDTAEEDAKAIAALITRTFRSCPTDATHADCPAARAYGRRLAAGDANAVLAEANRLRVSKGY